jgi:hypothetical protein
MKQLYKTLCLLLAGTLSVQLAAQGFYVGARVGYSWRTSPSNISGFYDLDVQGSTFNYEQVNVSLGKGLNAGLDLGYMFNENLGFQFGVDYLMGGKSKASFTDGDEYDNREIWSNMLRFNPGFIYIPGTGDIRPYGRVGAMLGVGAIHRTMDELENNDKTFARYKLDGGMACGWNTAVGVMVDLSSSFSFFGELNLVTMSYAPKKQVITEYTFNGTDRLPTLTTEQRETVFLKEYSENTMSSTPDYEPSKALKQRFNYNSMGIDLGVRLTF